MFFLNKPWHHCVPRFSRFFIALSILGFPAQALLQASLSDVYTEDTLGIYLQKQRVGTFLHSVGPGSAGRIIETTELSIRKVAGISGLDDINMTERSVYNDSGILIGAWQKLSSPSGKTQWELIQNAHGWSLSIATGGVTTVKKIAAPYASLVQEAAMAHRIKNRSIAKNTEFIDTAYDLTSSALVITRSVCVKLPSENQPNYVFMSTDDVSRKPCRVEINVQGKLVYQDIPPMFSAHRDNYVSSDTTKQSQVITDIFDVVKIPSERVTDEHDRIGVSLGRGIDLDETVKTLYERKDSCWILIPQAKTCSMLGSKDDPAALKYCTATPTMQSNDKRIRTLALAQSRGKSSLCDIVQSLNTYTYRTLVKRYTPTFSSALETLKAGYGDCGEHAVLLGAMLRSIGIPARIVYGLMYSSAKKGYLYHAWVMVSIKGSWFFADPAFGVFPASTDHIPLLLDDSGEGIIKLAAFIDNILVFPVSENLSKGH